MTFLRSFRPTHLLAARLGITRGQAATLLVGLAVAAVLTLGGLPPVLRRGPLAPGGLLTSAPAAESSEDAPADEAPEAATPENPELPAAPPLAPSGAVSFGGSSAPSSGSGSSSPEFTPTSSGPTGVQRLAELTGADGIAVREDATYVAANEAGSPSRVVVLGRDGATTATYRVTGQPGDRRAGLTGLAIDGDGLVALDAATARVLRFDRKGAQRTLAELPDLPACRLVVGADSGCEAGIGDDRPVPLGVAVAGDGTVFVTDGAQGVIWRIRPGARPEVLTNDFRFAGGDGVHGIAAAPDGTLLVSSPEAVDPEAAAGGAVYRIAADGERTLVARFPRGESPAGLAVVGDGVAVALPGAGVVVRLDGTGAETARLDGGDVGLERPVGVAVRDGILLVTDARGVVSLGDG